MDQTGHRIKSHTFTNTDVEYKACHGFSPTPEYIPFFVLRQQ